MGVSPRTRVTLLFLTLLGVYVAGCGDLTSGELDRGIGTLESAASEGAMIAREVAEDRIKTTFVRVRARELSDEVDHEAEKLADATPSPGQGRHRDTAVRIAEKIGDSLGVLQVYPEDERRGDRAETDLERLAERLSTLREQK